MATNSLANLKLVRGQSAGQLNTRQRSTNAHFTFQVTKKLNMFQHAKKLLIIDAESNHLVMYDDDMKKNRQIALADIVGMECRDRTKPLMLYLDVVGRGKEMRFTFESQDDVSRFTMILGAWTESHRKNLLRSQSDLGPGPSEKISASTSDSRSGSDGDASSGSSSDSASNGMDAIPNGLPTVSPTARSWLEKVNGSARNLTRSATLQDEKPRGLFKPTLLPSVDENASDDHSNPRDKEISEGWSVDFDKSKMSPLGPWTPNGAMRQSFKQQVLRHEASLTNEVKRSTAVHRYDPTDLFCGKKTIATVSAGLVVVAYPKSYLTGRAAIKQLRVGPQDNVEDLMSEVYAMSVSVHPNIIEFFSSYLWTDKDQNQNLWIVMEFMSYGSLTTCLEDAWDIWSGCKDIESVTAYVVKEVATGLAYLHSYNRLHRDIKSDNVFMGLGGSIKIGDLGCCVHLTKERQKRSEMQGTANWMAPECIMQKPYDSKIDVWSLGITLMEMLERDPPYFDETVYQAMYQICKHGVPALQEAELWSDECKDFLKKCTQSDPSKRSSSVELLDHPFCARAANPEYFEEVVRDCLGLPLKGGNAQVVLGPTLNPDLRRMVTF